LLLIGRELLPHFLDHLQAPVEQQGLLLELVKLRAVLHVHVLPDAILQIQRSHATYGVLLRDQGCTFLLQGEPRGLLEDGSSLTVSLEEMTLRGYVIRKQAIGLLGVGIQLT
jgi:hypothetical protein